MWYYDVLMMYWFIDWYCFDEILLSGTKIKMRWWQMTHHANSLYNIVNYGDLLIKNNVIKQGFQLNKSEQDPR
jgi:hypothetical protein